MKRFPATVTAQNRMHARPPVGSALGCVIPTLRTTKHASRFIEGLSRGQNFTCNGRSQTLYSLGSFLRRRQPFHGRNSRSAIRRSKNFGEGQLKKHLPCLVGDLEGVKPRILALHPKLVPNITGSAKRFEVSLVKIRIFQPILVTREISAVS